MQRKNIKFSQGVDFELIENLPNNGTNYLLKFDDSCEETSNSKQSENLLLLEDTGDRIRSIKIIVCFIRANWKEM